MGYTTEDIDEILEKIEHAVYSLNQENIKKFIVFQRLTSFKK
jgi:hypothetical protein